jgi:hypothetical protein
MHLQNQNIQKSTSEHRNEKKKKLGGKYAKTPVEGY